MNMQTTTQKNETISLIEALFTNICHDMAGVIGAISNAAELISISDLQEAEKIHKQAFELIQSSSCEAVQKIKIFRKAYSSGDNYTEVSLYDYCSDLLEMLAKKNINLILPVDSKQRYYKTYVAKIIINMILLLNGSITNKNSIKLTIKKSSENTLTISALCTTNNDLNLNQRVVDVLAGKKTETDSDTVQAAFLYKLAQHCNCILKISSGEKAAELSAMIKKPSDTFYQ